MRRVLVTGMSGTGKSTVVAALVARGIPAVDTDDGWCVPQPDGTLRWDNARLGGLLDDGPVVVAGCEENMVELLPRFDAVVLLSVPTPILLERIEQRTSNDFGKDPAERARILADLEHVEPLLRRIADVELVTDRPLDEIVDSIVEIAER